MRRFCLLFSLLMLLFSVFSAACAEVKPAKVYEAPKQIVITFAGDCTIGCTPTQRNSASGFEAVVKKEGYQYPFARMKRLFSGDDLTVSWENLPEREKGKDYTYRVTETELDGYEATIVSSREDNVLTFVITNTHVVTPKDEPTPDTPTPDEPAPDTPTPDTPTPDEPTPDKPTPDEPTPDKPTPNEPTPNEPVSNEPTPQKEYTRRTTKGAANTGDDSSLVLWSILGVASLAACGGALVLSRKKKNGHNGTHHR